MNFKIPSKGNCFQFYNKPIIPFCFLSYVNLGYICTTELRFFEFQQALFAFEKGDLGLHLLFLNENLFYLLLSFAQEISFLILVSIHIKLPLEHNLIKFLEFFSQKLANLNFFQSIFSRFKTKVMIILDFIDFLFFIILIQFFEINLNQIKIIVNN